MKKLPQHPSWLEETFALHCRALHVPEPVREFRFHPDRQWRADFAWPDAKLLVELDGGTAVGKGAHSRGAGYVNDCDKANAAAMLGWTMLRYTGKHLRDGSAVEQVQQFLAARCPLADLLAPVARENRPRPIIGTHTGDEIG